MSHIELTQGNDYVGARAFARTSNGWLPDVAQVRLLVWQSDDCNQLPVIDLLGVYSQASINGQAVAIVDIPRAETMKLKQGVRAYQFELKALTVDGMLTTLERGYVTVLGGGL